MAFAVVIAWLIAGLLSPCSAPPSLSPSPSPSPLFLNASGTCDGGRENEATKEVWPPLYGVIVASCVIVVVVLTLVFSVMVLVHCCKVSPRRQVYMLREVLPEPEEVERILEEIDSRSSGATNKASSPNNSAESVPSVRRPNLTLTAFSRQSNV